MIRYAYIYTSFLMLVLQTSCGRQRKIGLLLEDSNRENKLTVTSPAPNETYHTRYEYRDSMGKRFLIQNGFPRGGMKYTDPNGDQYGYAVFWTRIVNETDNPLELKIDFVDSYEIPSLPGKYVKLLVPPDTMTLAKESLFNHGLSNLKSFLDKRIHQPSSLIRTINPKESSGFYVVKLGGGDILRTGLNLKGQDLFYRVSIYNSSPRASKIISEIDIECGSISLKDLKFSE